MKRLPCAWFFLATALAVGCGEREMVTFSELCPGQPGEVPGVCGCGVPDVIDPATGDIVCEDLCPGDPNKIEPGVCGCGVPDALDPATGAVVCDLCPGDPNKIEPGVCGCGVPEVIDSTTGAVVCDFCPDDPNKTKPGICGCGMPDLDEHGNIACDECDIVDWDGDGVVDAEDACPYNPNITHASQGDCHVVVVDGTRQFQIWHAQDLLVMKAALEDTSNPPAWTEAVIMRDLNLRDLIDPDPRVACKSNSCDVSWTPIHLAGKTLSGRAHTIRFEYQNGEKRCQFTAPLFDTIVDATVTDLVLDYDVGGDSVASLAAEIRGSTLKNVQYRGDFATTHTPPENRVIWVGGIVARSEASTLLNLGFEGSFSTHGGGGNTGSIVGNSYNDMEIGDIHTKITHFQATGGGGPVGGMFGSISNATRVGGLYNRVDVMRTGIYGRVGGLAGSISNSHVFVVRNRVEAMTLESVNSSGGLVGEMSSSRLSNVENFIGTMEGGTTGVGGLAGSINQSRVTDVVNRVGKLEARGYYVGGLAGIMSAYDEETVVGRIDNSVGLVSNLGSGGSSGSTGGVVGWIQGDGVVLSRVVSYVEEVKGEHAVGGIVGSMAMGKIVVEGIASVVRRVEGVDAVGGILGMITTSDSPQPSVFRMWLISSQARVFADQVAAGVIGSIWYVTHTEKIDLSYIYSSAKVEAKVTAAGIGGFNWTAEPGTFVSSDRVYYHPWPEFVSSAFFEPSTDLEVTYGLLGGLYGVHQLLSPFGVCRWESGLTDIYDSELAVLGVWCWDLVE